jgi:outer membrane protein
MKNLAIVMFLVLAFFGCHKTNAQFNRGRWIAGGNMSLTTATSKTDLANLGEIKQTTINFSLGPQAGFFVINNLAVGAAVNFSASGTRGTTIDPSTSTVVDMKSKSNSISFGPFIRYYLPASIFFEIKTDFGAGKSSYSGGSFANEGKTSQFNYSGAVGYAYFLNDHVALEPTIGYHSYGSTYNDNINRRVGYWYLNAAFTIYLGERK